jgi:hypothetical protein
MPSFGASSCSHLHGERYLEDPGSKFLLNTGTKLHGTISEVTIILIFTDEYK